MSKVENQYKFCSSCGTKLSVKSKFCLSCGAAQKYMEIDMDTDGEKEDIKEETGDSSNNIVSQFPLEMKNGQKRNLNICYFLSLIGLLMAFSPKIFNITSMDKRGALTFLGGAIAIMTFVIGRLIFRARVKVLQSIIEGEHIIAYWKYSKAEWKHHVKEKYEETKGAYKGMFIFLMVLSTIIFLPFIIASKGNPIMIMVLVALLTACGIAAMISAASSKKVVSNAFVIISRDGVLINNSLHLWKGFGLRFKGAEYCKEDSSIILINYEVLYNRYAQRNQAAAVLIPKGKEQEAERVIKALNKEIH